MGQRMVGALADERLGAEGDAHSGEVEHGQIVGPVADGNDLLKRDFFLRGDMSEQIGLSGAVNDAARDIAGNDPVGHIH